MQMKELTSERNDLAREADALKLRPSSNVCSSRMPWTRSVSPKKMSLLSSASMMRQTQEAIESLREQVAAMQREVISAMDELDKLRSEATALLHALDAQRSESADLNLRLVVTLDRETALKEKIVDNEARAAEVMEARKQRIDMLL
jgi:septal ring factor EnvC (AmiA/AmiB activator)